jgi:hypothetical protein
MEEFHSALGYTVIRFEEASQNDKNTYKYYRG